VYRPKRCKSLTEILGDRPTSVRAMDAVAVRKADGTWEEKLAMVARYAAPAGGADEDEQRLILLGRQGDHVDVQVTLAPRYGAVSMLRAASYRGRSTKEAAHRAIACYLGRKGGCLLRYQATRSAGKDAWNASNNPSRFQLDAGRLISMRRVGGGEPAGRRPHDHIGNFLVAGRRGMALLDCSASATRKIASFQTEGAVLAASRPHHTLAGEEQPVYVLERQRDAGTAVTAYRVPYVPGPDGKKKERPVVLTGDCLFARELEAETGVTGGQVTLEAHAFDPEGLPVLYSWTAAGIEFDDPTSPTPTAFFPLGETLVYLVVRDGLADDPETLESRPCLVRVSVTLKEPVDRICGDPNGDRQVNIGDAVFILSYLFAHGTPPSPLTTADVNASGQVDIADAVYLLSYLFAQGQPPACPATGP
jgi:hypothetical protein